MPRESRVLSVDARRYDGAMALRVHRLFKRATTPSCPGCGFSLQGLADRGACPECGSAYDPSNAFALIPPSTLRSLVHGGAPLAWGLLLTLVLWLIGAWSGRGGELIPIALAFLGGIAMCAGIAWSAWRFVGLIDAHHDARTTTDAERPTTRAFGCLGTGVAATIGVVAIGLGAMLTLLLGACLISGAPGYR
jgi:hypothetical protein